MNPKNEVENPFDSVLRSYRSGHITQHEAFSKLVSMSIDPDSAAVARDEPAWLLALDKKLRLTSDSGERNAAIWCRFWESLLEFDGAMEAREEYLRSRLTPVVPAGRHYVVHRTTQVEVVPHFHAPFSDQYPADLVDGDEFLIKRSVFAEEDTVLCGPVDGASYESRLVTQAYRDDPHYRGFSLLVPLVALDECCDIVEPT